MWLSKKFKTASVTPAEVATVATGGAEIEATSTKSQRAVSAFSPYGYSYSAPSGNSVLLVDSGAGVVSAGTKMENMGLENGEVQITSLGGASILFKNDGTVVINNCLFVTPEGEISVSEA